MWTPLALAALSLTPVHHQPAGLQLTNVRLTVGELGPNRPNNKFLPGDIVVVGYDIEGLSIEQDGIVKYTILMEVSDPAGKPIFKQEPKEFTELIPLRGSKVPARAFVTLGLDMEPGIYTVKVTVSDPKTKSSNSLSTKFEVLKKDFGIVAVMTTHDPRAEIAAPTTGTVGQTIYVWMSIANFQRDPKTKQPNVELELTFLDDQGKPTLGQPIKRIQDSGIEADRGAFPIFFPLYLNRPGKFTLRVTATDRVANKKASYELTFTALPSN
jgi:hypothetical protein